MWAVSTPTYVGRGNEDDTRVQLKRRQNGRIINGTYDGDLVLEEDFDYRVQCTIVAPKAESKPACADAVVKAAIAKDRKELSPTERKKARYSLVELKLERVLEIFPEIYQCSVTIESGLPDCSKYSVGVVPARGCEVRGVSLVEQE